MSAVASAVSDPLSADWVLHLLLNRGLLTPGDAVLASPTVEETSMSHSCFCVRLGGVPAWYLKRGDPVRSQGRDLGAEAYIYQLAAAHPELQQVIPRCRLIGEGGNAVLLDAVPGKPLSLTPVRSGPVLHACGAAIARVHQVQCPPFGTPPWLLDALEPQWGDYSWLPRGCAAMFARLAASATFRNGFRTARMQWRATNLIHGDIRWSNILADEESEPVKIWLLDWELASTGDPAWDVGSALADVAASAAMGDSKARPSEAPLRGAIELLKAYAAGAPMAPASWTALVRRSLTLAGLRLVQTIVEYGYGSDSELTRAEGALVPWVAWLFTNSESMGLELAAAARGGD